MQVSITQATLQDMRKVEDQCSDVLPAICSSVSWSAWKEEEAINTPNVRTYPERAASFLNEWPQSEGTAFIIS